MFSWHDFHDRSTRRFKMVDPLLLFTLTRLDTFRVDVHDRLLLSTHCITTTLFTLSYNSLDFPQSFLFVRPILSLGHPILFKPVVPKQIMSYCSRNCMNSDAALYQLSMHSLQLTLVSLPIPEDMTAFMTAFCVVGISWISSGMPMFSAFLPWYTSIW